MSIDLAYIAGLMDGESYIGIKKSRAYECQGRISPGYHARIQIRMVDEPAIAFIASTLGGWYYPETRPQPNRKPLYCYQATDAKAESILRAVLPYLRVKRCVAEVVLALRDLQSNGRAHKTKQVGTRTIPHWCGKVVIFRTFAFSDDYVARCDTLYREAKRLNAVGIGGKGVPYDGENHRRGCHGNASQTTI